MSFTSRWQMPGRLLGDLKTAENFLHVAENDMETALRLLSTRILWKCRLCRICMCGHSMTA